MDLAGFPGVFYKETTANGIGRSRPNGPQRGASILVLATLSLSLTHGSRASAFRAMLYGCALAAGLAGATPIMAQTSDPQSSKPLPRVVHFYDAGSLDVGGAARVPASPDAYRRPYDQYLGGWREPPPPLQSAYVPAVGGAVATAPPVASWAVQQNLPPLQEVQATETKPGAAKPGAAKPDAAKPDMGKPGGSGASFMPTLTAPNPAGGQVAQAAPAASPPPAPPPADDANRLRYGTGSKYGVSELRFGILAHNKGPIASKLEHGAQVNIEARFTSPDFMKILFEPRPTVGASLNTAGDTSFLYGGLTWGGFLWKGLFVEGFFGMAVHNGELDSKDPEYLLDRKQFGSRVVFREQVEVGYRFLDVHSISFMVDHYSNAGWLATRNQGNDDFGLRYGYKL